jgi:mRNA interferase HigB
MMRVISHKKIIDFTKIHRDGEKPLGAWYKIITHTEFSTFAALKNTFPTADNVGKFTVFNIGGNKFRLIAAIHYNTQMLYIRNILTHCEYDRNKWKE